MTYSTTLSLTQTGKFGDIHFNVTADPINGNTMPESYAAMTKLAAVWHEIQPLVADQISEDGTDDNVTYRAEFTLSQDDEEIVSRLEMNPRVSAVDHVYPTAYQAASYIASLYLVMMGVIDENGRVIDEKALNEKVEMDVLQSSARVH